MGLFKKSSKGKPQYLNVDLTDFNVKWESFSTALPNILDTGSQDVKKSEFQLPAGTYMIFTHNSQVKGVLPPSSHFTVKNYLEDVPEEELLPEVREALSKVSAADDIYRYDALCQAVPEAKDFLAKLFYSLNLETALRLSQAMEGNSIQILTEPVFAEALEQSLLSWDFFDKTAEDTLQAVDVLKLRQDHAIDRMEIGSLLASPLKVVEEWQVTTVEEGYLKRQALAGTSVEDLLSGPADGFLSSTLLESLERLILQGKVTVEGLVMKEEEELPDYAAMLGVQSTSTPEVVLNNGVFSSEEAVSSRDEGEVPQELKDFPSMCDIRMEDSAFTEVEEEAMPEEIAEADEWSFEEELLDGEDDKPHFVPTGFLLTNLRPKVYPLIKEYNLDDDLKRKVRAHLRENSRLEKEVARVEALIEPLSKDYSHGVEVYDEMKFTKSLDDLKNDGVDPTEAEVETVESAPAMVEQQDESNEEFFTLAKLEEERHQLNEARKKELYGLLGGVPFEGDDARTIDLQDLIESKLRGISHVKTIAFHPPADGGKHDKLVAELVDESTMLGVDDKLPDVLEEEVEEVEGEEKKAEYVIDIDAPDPREGSLAIIYYQLVDEWGEDPLELYKEDMRIKRDGGDPYAPRPTKYSRRLNSAWEKLQAEKTADENLEAQKAEGEVSEDNLSV